MSSKLLVVGACLLFFAACSSSAPAEEKADEKPDVKEAEPAKLDPYEILAKHYEAMGGLEKLKAVQTEYSEGIVTTFGSEGEEQKGSFKQWRRFPLMYRQELNLGDMEQISGDDGRKSWVVAMGGMPQVFGDEAAVKARKVRGLLAQYDHLDRDSESFAVKYAGTEKVDGAKCHVVEISNRMNDDVSRQYFDEESYLLIREVITRPSGEERITYSNYRETDGLMHAFTRVKESGSGTSERGFGLETTTLEVNPTIDPKRFRIPTPEV